MVDALVTAVRNSFPRLSHRYYAMKAKWLGLEKLQALGPQRAAAGGAGPQHRLARGGEDRARQLCRLQPGAGRVGGRFFEKPWMDAALRPGKPAAPSPTRRCLRRTPICC